MELKRILARDTRSATEQAMAMYGPDVLIISNNRVSGQTELVVALDVAAESATSVLNEEMPTVMPSVPVVAASPEKIEAKEASPSGTDNAFGDHLHVLLTRGAGVSAPASAPRAAAPAADGPVTVSFDDAFDSEISSEIGDLGPGGAAGGEGSGGRDDRGGRGGRDRGPRRHR